MPSTLILHFLLPPSEPLVQHLPFHVMTATCKVKHQLQNSRISTSSKVGDVAQHSKVGKRLFSTDTSVMTPVSEKQEYLGLTVKVKLMQEFMKEPFTSFPLVLMAKQMFPPHAVQIHGAASSPVSPFRILHFSNSLVHLHILYSSLLVQHQLQTAQYALCNYQYRASDLAKYYRDFFFFCKRVHKAATFLPGQPQRDIKKSKALQYCSPELFCVMGLERLAYLFCSSDRVSVSLYQLQTCDCFYVSCTSCLRQQKYTHLGLHIVYEQSFDELINMGEDIQSGMHNEYQYS